ncbi:hypothetical protein HCCG_01281 [Helicobacter cinaedi CCUG 18818 = ATCC BAA-847]|uniref:Transcriptional regulator n=1 Tax=Helicobacter cinaedi CCUG 18818 = ATCC BAA-847 TaxID=537971 RepID=A0ABN0BB03_9HELI|nr:hypothetical protein [Helicobacter cinaedi]EFR46734.1 hypothetical protein HCCG_01281 [Helicobacter cinaedi CCUG 18818 = ATCC BAA-847]
MKNNPFSLKLTQRDIAGILNIDTKTLYNWRKNKKELYAVVMLGFKFKEILSTQQNLTKELELIESQVLSQTRLNSTPPPPPAVAMRQRRSRRK